MRSIILKIFKKELELHLPEEVCCVILNYLKPLKTFIFGKYDFENDRYISVYDTELFKAHSIKDVVREMIKSDFILEHYTREINLNFNSVTSKLKIKYPTFYKEFETLDTDTLFEFHQNHKDEIRQIIYDVYQSNPQQLLEDIEEIQHSHPLDKCFLMPYKNVHKFLWEEAHWSIYDENEY